MASNNQDRSAYQAYTQSNQSSGYDPIGTLGYNQPYVETTNPSMGYEDKWARWFGQPPFGHFQQDNYAMLGHENYQLPTAYIGRNLHIEKLINVSIASEDDYYTRVRFLDLQWFYDFGLMQRHID